jgi:hypothetical protein
MESGGLLAKLRGVCDARFEHGSESDGGDSTSNSQAGVRVLRGPFAKRMGSGSHSVGSD